MKAVIQRVLSASVTIDSEVVSSIGKGMLVLVAVQLSSVEGATRQWCSVSPNDTTEDGKSLATKLLSLKMWPTDTKPWAQSVKDISGEILCVSQFTLFANINKGSKPDFHGSAPLDIARPLYDQFVETMRVIYEPDRVKGGVFGAMMQVGLINDGPVTFDFDTAKKKPGNILAQKQKDDNKKWMEKKLAGEKAERNQKSGSETSVTTEATADGDENSSLAEFTKKSKMDNRS
ncbi:D-Tyr tRNAtyr deacylase-like domain-containing protein [Terfezia claveryi]|nr:D-Tyr tRNAtyr deacylase-like domain-containing protein [Terfezia claveryi]